jgi:hypothetical protein
MNARPCRLIGLAAWLVVTMVTILLQAAQFEVKEGPETCSNAHLVLVASKSGKHDYIWGEIGKVVRSGNGKWIVVDDYEPGVVQKVSFRQYEVKGQDGAHAYVAHCGHGGTCNSLAHAFFEEHDDWYSPEVFCGLVPSVLENPQKVSF